MNYYDSAFDEVIDKASIIENKERTKIYWEQKMIAAANEKNRNSGRGRLCNTIDNRSHGDSYKMSLTQRQNGGKNKRNSYENEWDSELALLNDNNQKNGKNSSEESYPTSMEGKIALELQEMKEREEELRELRRKMASENRKETTPPKDIMVSNGTEELSSLQTTDDSNYSEYGSEEKEHSLEDNGRIITPCSDDFMHMRTQSLDSVSSGHSSGSGSNSNDRDFHKRKVLVRPYHDPELEENYNCYSWDGKETPIEREIRIAREREEELKREKGTVTIIENCRVLSRKNKNKSYNKKELLENDPRGIQQRLATSRIQQEIEEATERERELQTEGKIISTSEETSDSKVTTLLQLVENSIIENRLREQRGRKTPPPSHKLFSSSTCDTISSDRQNQSQEPDNNFIRKNKNKMLKKGLMEKFLLTRGKSFGTLNTTPQYYDEYFESKPIVRQSFNTNGDVTAYVRKGYIPVTEKIQEELIDNQKREEELRLQRARMMARSQPDLLSISDSEEQEIKWSNREERPTPGPRLVHSLSNPNLLDDSFDKVHKRPSSKRFSLLEEWEKRTRGNV